jgi:hypothetical protein
MELQTVTWMALRLEMMMEIWMAPKTEPQTEHQMELQTGHQMELQKVL